MFSQMVPDMKANGSVPCEMGKAFKPGQAELDTKASGRTIRLTGWANFGTYSEQLKNYKFSYYKTPQKMISY